MTHGFERIQGEATPHSVFTAWTYCWLKYYFEMWWGNARFEGKIEGGTATVEFGYGPTCFCDNKQLLSSLLYLVIAATEMSSSCGLKVEW